MEFPPYPIRYQRLMTINVCQLLQDIERGILEESTKVWIIIR